MQRDFIKIIRNILWGLIGFNAITVLCFILPPGRVYYMPEILAYISAYLAGYSMFGMFFSGIISAVVTTVLFVIRLKKEKIFEKNMIILFILFVLTIPLGIFLLEAGMSV